MRWQTDETILSQAIRKGEVENVSRPQFPGKKFEYCRFYKQRFSKQEFIWFSKSFSNLIVYSNTGFITVQKRVTSSIGAYIYKKPF